MSWCTVLNATLRSRRLGEISVVISLAIIHHFVFSIMHFHSYAPPCMYFETLNLAFPCCNDLQIEPEPPSPQG